MLGEQYFASSRVIVLTDDQVKSIENKLMNFMQPMEYKKLLPELSKIRKRTIKDMLKSYPEYVISLSKRYGKEINSFKISGDEFLIEVDVYNRLIKSLINVFRNSVYHGIETPEERIEKGKFDFGNISCIIKLMDKYFTITIEDDGKGIDIESIKNQILLKGLESSVKHLSHKEIIDYLFNDEFTTSLSINDVSGRGEGLAAVKNEVENLNGSIKVESKKDVFTRFIFSIPLNNKEIKHSEFLKHLKTTLKNVLISYMHDNFDFKLIDNKISDCDSNNIKLGDYNSYINFQGILNGRMFLISDNKITISLVKKYIMGDISTEEENEFAEDVIAEVTNNVFGKIAEKMEDLSGLFTISSPTIISKANGVVLKYTKSILMGHSKAYSYCLTRTQLTWVL